MVALYREAQVKCYLRRFRPTLTLLCTISFIPISHVAKRYYFYDVLKEYGNYTIYDLENSPYLDKQMKHKWVLDPKAVTQFAIKLDAIMTHLTDFYVNSYGSYGTEEYLIIKMDNHYRISPQIYSQFRGIVVASYDNVMAVGNARTVCFGHFILDVLCPMVLFPDEIIHKSKIICPNSGFSEEFMTALGVNSSQLLYLEKGEWVFANNLYISEKPNPHGGHLGKAIIELSQRLKKSFGIENVTATQYAFTNRDQPKRAIETKTFNKVFSEIQRLYPEHKWIFIPDKYKTQRDSALTYSRIKFLITPTGSGIVRMIYMQPNSVILALHANRLDPIMASTAIAMKIQYVAYMVSNNGHFEYTPMSFPIEKLWPAFNYSYQMVPK